ncbi:hypothetical protein ABIC28_000818 [Rhodococcus sp. PvR044]
MVAVVDPGFLFGVDVRRWDPFGASGVFGGFGRGAGLPAAGAVVDECVAAVASEGHAADVGGAALGPVVDVVDGGHGGGGVAAGSGAASIGGDQRESLVCGGEAFRTSEVQWSAVVVEEHQYWVRAFGHRQCVSNGEDPAGRGGGDTRGVFELIEGHGDDRGYRQPAMGTEDAGCEECAQCFLDGVVVALRGGAGVAARGGGKPVTVDAGVFGGAGG